ncbi:MAG: amidohydrolase family protein, partial [Campylobacteraceae bacterium]|nr:amidohydrolase family protein [Campylobacteraceae bacterium]MDY4121704.1 amidohydrolase family protein [Campylobacter sp.]
SNLSLSIWDEMRAGIMIHKDTHLDTLARTLLLMTTKNAARALDFDSGEIKVGKNADIACFALPAGSKKSRLALDLILHTKEAKSLFIDGEKIF